MSFRGSLFALAAGSLAASCTTGVANAPPGPAWLDAGTPIPSTVEGREAGFYKDGNGILWDDRGKKRDNTL